MTLASTGNSVCVADLRVTYESDVEIIRGVCMNARSQQITGVIGPNGAGKSTLLRAIAGVVPVRSGRIEMGGVDMTFESPRARLERGIAFVPQERSVFPEMTVAENLRMGGWVRRNERTWLSSRIEEVCNLFPLLAEKLSYTAGDLSGGQQKILELARALIGEPAVLLLDEPTAPLSPEMADQVYEEIRRLNNQLRVTIILVDQNIRKGLAITDYVYALAMGVNDAEGPSDDVIERLPQIVEGWLGIEGSGVVK